MKISNETVGLFKNFATINSNILIRQGEELSTMSASKNIFAKANIKETFAREIPIYDLNRLLATLSLNPQSEVTLHDDRLELEVDGGVFNYFYSDPSVIVSAPEKEISGQEIYNFKLSQDQLEKLFEVSAVAQATMVSIVGNGTEVCISVGDPAVAQSNFYHKKVAESDKVFKAHLPVDSLKVMTDEYNVTVCTNNGIGFLYFENATNTLRYWLALDRTSEF